MLQTDQGWGFANLGYDVNITLMHSEEWSESGSQVLPNTHELIYFLLPSTTSCAKILQMRPIGPPTIYLYTPKFHHSLRRKAQAHLANHPRAHKVESNAVLSVQSGPCLHKLHLRSSSTVSKGFDTPDIPICPGRQQSSNTRNGTAPTQHYSGTPLKTL